MRRSRHQTRDFGEHFSGACMASRIAVFSSKCGNGHLAGPHGSRKEKPRNAVLPHPGGHRREPPDAARKSGIRFRCGRRLRRDPRHVPEDELRRAVCGELAEMGRHDPLALLHPRTGEPGVGREPVQTVAGNDEREPDDPGVGIQPASKQEFGIPDDAERFVVSAQFPEPCPGDEAGLVGKAGEKEESGCEILLRHGPRPFPARVPDDRFVAVGDIGIEGGLKHLLQHARHQFVAGIEEQEVVATRMGGTLVHGVVDAFVRLRDMPSEVRIAFVGRNGIEAAIGRSAVYDDLLPAVEALLVFERAFERPREAAGVVAANRNYRKAKIHAATPERMTAASSWLLDRQKIETETVRKCPPAGLFSYTPPISRSIERRYQIIGRPLPLEPFVSRPES